MRRRIFTFASVVPLMLCAATVVLWVRSRSHFDACYRSAFLPTGAIIASGSNSLYFEINRNFPQPQLHDAIWSVESKPTWNNMWQPRILGFGWGHEIGYFESGDAVPMSKTYFVLIPDWFAMTALLLGSALFYRLGRRKVFAGCPTCRYNLAGNTSGVCPKCGTPAAGKVEAKS